MALLKCLKVEPGLRDSEATVTVEEYNGTPQHFPVDRGMLSKREGETYLSVSPLGADLQHCLMLVSLPVEADSGANRIWVRNSDVLSGAKTEAR